MKATDRSSVPAAAVSRWPRGNRPQFIARRQLGVRSLPHWHASHDHVLDWPLPVESLARFQECLTGHMVLPVGVVGPLSLHLGVYELTKSGALAEARRVTDRVYVPLAHTEGGLSASLQRGVTATALAGGIRTYLIADRMTRDSCFVFRSIQEAERFACWVAANASAMADWLRSPRHSARASRTDRIQRSTYAVLREVDTHIVGPMCHVLYRFTTGDACGPNLISRNAHSLNHDFILDRFPREAGVAPLRVFLETNMGGDKKPSAAFFQFPGHGKVVLAETTISGAILRRVLRIQAADLIALEHAGLHGAHASGMQSFAFTPASAIAAIFAATGQDLGMVGTSSMSQLTASPSGDGLHLAIRFSGLEVGTVGGGTSLPHARAYLQLMDCLGSGRVYRFAQIVAAAALCLELSAAASMAANGSRNFVEAHFARGGLR